MAGATPSAVAGVYAQALIELAEERGKRPAVVDDCRELARVLTEDASVLAGLEDPRVGKERAKLALAEGLGKAIQAETFNLVRLLIDRNRLRDLPAIASEAVKRAERAAGVVHIAATTRPSCRRRRARPWTPASSVPSARASCCTPRSMRRSSEESPCGWTTPSSTAASVVNCPR